MDPDNRPDNRADSREFLATRRARLTPANVWLLAGNRRRVPGVRREEAAVLAGVGIEWYTRLEKDHIAGVSEEVLEAVAGALLLTRPNLSGEHPDWDEHGQMMLDQKQVAHPDHSHQLGAHRHRRLPCPTLLTPSGRQEVSPLHYVRPPLQRRPSRDAPARLRWASEDPHPEKATT